MRLLRPSVVRQVSGRVRVEHGSIDDVGTPDRVAVLVHWSASPVVARSFRTLVQQFAGNGYRPVVVSACEIDQPLDWNGALPGNAVVLRKPNIGYDFGSWAVALDVVPGIAASPNVVLANDSLIGPFASLTSILNTFEQTPVDVWGLTDTRQFFLHIQSYFLGFHGGVLNEPVIRRFWRGVRQERTKWDIIYNNEMAFSRLLYREGFSTKVAYRGDDIVAPGFNPVITGWQPLLRAGFPFVKREIVRNPAVAPGGHRVAREVMAVYGTHLSEWI